MTRLLVAALSVLLLTGCTNMTLPVPDAVAEADYIQLVQQNIPGFATATTETLRSLGESTCTILDKGGEDGWSSNVETLTDGGVSKSDAGKYIALAVASYCPELLSTLPNESN